MSFWKTTTTMRTIETSSHESRFVQRGAGRRPSPRGRPAQTMPRPSAHLHRARAAEHEERAVDDVGDDDDVEDVARMTCAAGLRREEAETLQAIAARPSGDGAIACADGRRRHARSIARTTASACAHAATSWTRTPRRRARRTRARRHGPAEASAGGASGARARRRAPPLPRPRRAPGTTCGSARPAPGKPSAQSSASRAHSSSDWRAFLAKPRPGSRTSLALAASPLQRPLGGGRPLARHVGHDVAVRVVRVRREAGHRRHRAAAVHQHERRARAARRARRAPPRARARSLFTTRRAVVERTLGDDRRGGVDGHDGAAPHRVAHARRRGARSAPRPARRRAPGRVDSAPTSIMSAPSESIASICARARLHRAATAVGERSPACG